MGSMNQPCCVSKRREGEANLITTSDGTLRKHETNEWKETTNGKSVIRRLLRFVGLFLGVSDKTLPSQRLVLQFHQPPNPGLGDIQLTVQKLATEGAILAGALHFDELASAGHHDVHIDPGPAVFDVA